MHTKGKLNQSQWPFDLVMGSDEEENVLLTDYYEMGGTYTQGKLNYVEPMAGDYCQMGGAYSQER